MRGTVTEVYKLFAKQDHCLVVPVYQRNYDWQQSHCARLLTDLKDLKASGRRRHFFGAVVGQQEGFWNWQVIDGQQRLTTLSLLILALTKLIDTDELSYKSKELSGRLRRSYLQATEANSGPPTFRLKPVKNDAEAYQRLFGDESQLIESSNVTANYRFFLEELPKLGMTAEEIWDGIMRLEVMHLDLEEHDEPQRIFESLNSTGLALSESDKIRNLVLMGLPSDEQELVYEDYWNRIELNADYHTDEFIRWYLVSRTTTIPRKDEVYEAFKKFSGSTGQQGADLLDGVRYYSEHYRDLLNASVGSKPVDQRLKRLNILKQDVTLPFLMPVLADYRAQDLDEHDLIETLRITETYLFRRSVCDLATNSLNRVFASLYREVKRLKKEGDTFPDVLAYLLIRRTGSARMPRDEEFSIEFETRNMYRFQPQRRRYLFECLENGNSRDTVDVAQRLLDGDLSIEHIMPQNLTLTWRNELGEDAEEIHQEWLHRVANLTVTGYNSAYSNLSFADKKEHPEGFANSPYRLNDLLRRTEHWGVEELKRRSRILLDAALAYWPLPGTTFEPPKRVLVEEPLGDDTDFTGRAVVAFQFKDTSQTVSTWRDLLVEVLRILESMHHEILFAQVETQNWLSAQKQPKFRKVAEGLFVYASTSTREKCRQLRILFDVLGEDPEELTLMFPADENQPSQNVDGSDLVEQLDDGYVDLKKFIAVFEPRAGEVSASSEDNVELVRQFTEAMEPYMVSDMKSVLGTLPAAFARSQERVENASENQILGLLTAKVLENQNMDPEALHYAIMDGTLVGWLRKL